MQLPIHYGLPINNLSSVFDYRATSYKYYWFLSILEQVNSFDERDISIDSILKEMIANVWYPVNFFKLSLGKQDQLQNIIKNLKDYLRISPDIDKQDLINLINKNNDREINNLINDLGRYVPYRFLTPWFLSELRGTPDTKKNKKIFELARKTFEIYPNPPLYKFSNDGTKIIVHKEWFNYLRANYVIIRGFTFWHILNYLKINNPNVPNLQEKLIPPLSRGSLSIAKNFWKPYLVKLSPHCVYSNQILDPINFSIDHYLPWSFVAHNELWNLIPTSRQVNSAKSDNLPSEEYFARFLSMQYSAFRFSVDQGSLNGKYLEDYSNLFKTSVRNIYCLQRTQFDQKLYDTIQPLIQIAINTGFSPNWKYEH